MKSIKKPILALPLTLAILCSLTVPGLASIGIDCRALDGSKADIIIGLSGGVGFGALYAEANDGKGGKYFYQTEEKTGTEFTIAQGMILGEKLYADFSDPNAEEIFVSLRVNVDLVKGFKYPKPSDESDNIFGTLIFKGQKPIPVSCDYG